MRDGVASLLRSFLVCPSLTRRVGKIQHNPHFLKVFVPVPVPVPVPVLVLVLVLGYRLRHTFVDCVGIGSARPITINGSLDFPAKPLVGPDPSP